MKQACLPIAVYLLGTSVAFAQVAPRPDEPASEAVPPGPDMVPPAPVSGTQPPSSPPPAAEPSSPNPPHPSPAESPAVPNPPAPFTSGAAASRTPDPNPPVPPPAPAPQTGVEGLPAPASPLKLETSTGSIRLGLLLQPQYETVGSSSLNKMSQNLYLRRTRILVGGTLFSVFDYFVETDFADLFKADATTGGKNTPGMNLQDVMFTYHTVGERLMFDAGYMLPPLSHNAVQSAATLYGWDYFANSFRHGTAFNSSASPAGRDTGLQARGLLVGTGLIEYRIGAFQGIRHAPNSTRVGSANFFRVAGRIQLNILDPETGFFYAGTYLGRQKILSFGASLDLQGRYEHWSVDGLLDLPLGPGLATAQANLAYWNGRHSLTLPSQTAFMGEAGYLFKCVLLSPIVRYEQRWVAHETAATPDEARWGGGLAFWPYGHNINVKAFYQRVVQNPRAHAFDQVNVQAQLFVY